MTRRRIIAGVILVAAAAVAVPLVPGVWLKVAYREERVNGLVYLVRRSEWLPGRAVCVPDQVCFACLNGAHDICLRMSASREYLELVKVRLDVGSDVTLLEYPSTFRCTCTDSSHDGD